MFITHLHVQISPSQFEAHAGRPATRKPWVPIVKSFFLDFVVPAQLGF